MSLTSDDDMTPLDRIVYDPRFAPYYGWHDDHRAAHYAGQGYLAAMWQVRSEFHAFAKLLLDFEINGRCLQLGLGFCASHMVFRQLFSDVWTIDLDSTNVSNLISAVGPVDTVVIGSTHDPGIQARVKASGKFDLIFIDADHRFDDVRADYIDYAPLVRQGGIIAFHDSFPQWEHNGVWLLLNKLRSEGHDIQVIGNEIGIAWMIAT